MSRGRKGGFRSLVCGRRRTKSVSSVGVDFRQLCFALLVVFVVVLGLFGDPFLLSSSAVERPIFLPSLSQDGCG